MADVHRNESTCQLSAPHRIQSLDSAHNSESEVRLDQFRRDCRAACLYCRGEYGDTDPGVFFDPVHLIERGVRGPLWLHRIGDRDSTPCRADAIRKASPELNALDLTVIEETNGQESW